MFHIEVMKLTADYKFVKTRYIDDYISLVWADRFYDIGEFELRLSEDVIDPGDYITNPKTDECMIVENVEVSDDPEDGHIVTVKGKSIKSMLRNRVLVGKNYYKAPLYRIVALLVGETIIQPENPKRKIPNFTFYPLFDDETVPDRIIEVAYDNQVLYDVIDSICKNNGLGFTIKVRDNKFVFMFTKGSDRSYDQTIRAPIIFSPNFENLISSSRYLSIDNLKNVCYVVGDYPLIDPKQVLNTDRAIYAYRKSDGHISLRLNAGIEYTLKTTWHAPTGMSMYDYNDSTVIYASVSNQNELVFKPPKDVDVTIAAFWQNPNDKPKTNDLRLTIGDDERQDHVVEVGKTEGVWRRETLENCRSSYDENESLEDFKKYMAETGKAILEENNVIDALTGEIDRNNDYIYGIDYFLGDIVQVEDFYGNSRPVIIGEIVISSDANGTVQYPTFIS